MVVLIEKTTNNWIEVTFSDENKEKECHYFSGEKEHIESLNLKIKEYEITLTKEQEDLIKETQANFVYPNPNLLALEIEKTRILSIKQKTGQIINSKYDIYWQLNHPRLDITYTDEYKWIDNIRAIGNKAELEGTALEDIEWGVL